MTKRKYRAIRTKAYKLAGELGTIAELSEYNEATGAYSCSQTLLDSIDEIGIRLGYLNADTLEYTWKLVKRERGADYPRGTISRVKR